MRTLLAALFVIVSLAGASPAHASSYTAERFDSRIDVLAGGSLRVTETIVFRFESGTFTRVFRTIPSRNTDGLEVIAASMDGADMPEGMEDASKLPKITEALLRKGYPDSDVRKILGENTLRIMEQAERVSAEMRQQK